MYADSEDGAPLEDPAELLETAEADTRRLEWLIRAINHTNSTTLFDACDVTGTLTDALARRDALASLHKTLSEALKGVGSRRRRYFDDRPAGKLAIDVAAWRRRADDTAAKLRQLDLAIQALNWATDVCEP